MSSQDKAGPKDGTEDTAADDHAPDNAAELPETGIDGPETRQETSEDDHAPERPDIEDAEIVAGEPAGTGRDAGAPHPAPDWGPFDAADYEAMGTSGPRAGVAKDDDAPDDGAGDGDSDPRTNPPGNPVDHAGDADADPVPTPTGDAPADDVLDPAGHGAADDDPNSTGAAAAAALAGASAAMGAGSTDADPARPAAAAPEASAKAPAQKSGGGFMPALLGGVIAAGLGFGTAVYMGGDLMGGDDALEQALIAQDSKLAELDARLADLADALTGQPDTGTDDQISALGDRLVEQLGGVTERIEALATTVDTVQDRLSGLEDQLGALDGSLGDVSDRLDAVERRPMTESSEAAQAAFSAYERDLEELRAALDAQTEANETLTAQLEEREAGAQAEVEAAAARAAELQAQAEEQARVAEEQYEARARAAAMREAMATLDAALEKGAPYTAPLGLLADAGEVPEPLAAAAEGGVASLPDLQAEFPPLARDALDASIRETVADDVTGRAYAFLRAQTGLRSLEPRDGDDPDAILSRAEAALNSGDLATALSELEQLPSAGQDVMSDWMVRAEQRRAVTEAAATLADTLLAN